MTSARQTPGTARVHDPVTPEEGQRVLVDRLWPRGIRRDDPRVGTWLKDVAPSHGLRRWYGHDPERQADFERRYEAELAEPEAAAAFEELAAVVDAGSTTLVTATKDLGLSHVVVLARLLGQRS